MEQSPTRDIIVVSAKWRTKKTNDHIGSKEKKVKIEKITITSLGVKEARIISINQAQAGKEGCLC